ncbi:hypothetical protein M8J77_011918 [Diaphorina citri]|nr:hypothetical protein M8J77_011918 [Diaphorina citri]
MLIIIKELLTKDFIRPLPHSIKSGFISPMFVRLKANGSTRPIFNLRRLNNYIKVKRFHLINHFRVPQFLQQGDFLATLDLSDAYCHIKIAKRHRRFLAFSFEGRMFAWSRLPFGLSSAPQAFCQLTNWVASHLRSLGIRVIVYLDDFLFAAQSPDLLRAHVEQAVNILLSLGWKINLKKSHLNPSQSATFLGLKWETIPQRVSLPEDKLLSLRKLLTSLLNRPIWSLRSYQRLLGTLNFASFAVPLGRLHLRPLQLAARSLPKTLPRRSFPIPPSALTSLTWWMENMGTGNVFSKTQDSIVLTTDASDWGLGATIGSSTHLCQEWTQEQRNWHINRRELFTVYWAILSAPQFFKNRSITLLSDNKTVVAHIRNQGGLRSLSLLKETHRLLLLIQSLQAKIQPLYFPGRFNTLADSLSRNSPPPEWHLSEKITSLIFRRWGTPSIDLFASHRSAVISTYVTIDPHDTQALFVDAFSRPWKFNLAWVFPPPPLVPLVLEHLNKASGTFLLVVPRWTKTFWRPDLKARAVDAPIRLPNLEQDLLDLMTNRPPPKVHDIQLEVWKVRGGPPTSRRGLNRNVTC